MRVEKKYLIDKPTLDAFMKEIAPYVIQDQYGQYTICNVYYDTAQDELIRQSLEKPTYKEKMRLRSYGVPTLDDKVFIELKKKYKGTVFKRRIVLPLAQALNYLAFGGKPIEDSQILHEIDYVINMYHLIPRLYLAYERIAYLGKDNRDLRITVDCNIRSRTDRLDLREGDDGELLLNKGQYLLEIKTSSAFPLWLTSTLSSLHVYPTSFSKYGQIYTKNLMKDRGNKKCLQAS